MTGSDTMGGGMYGSDRDGVRAAFADGAVSFWEALDALVGGAEIVVDRPRGSHHPDFPEFVYELDYGYLKGTTSADSEGIDVWIGSDPRRQVTGALCTVVRRHSRLRPHSTNPARRKRVRLAALSGATLHHS